MLIDKSLSVIIATLMNHSPEDIRLHTGLGSIGVAIVTLPMAGEEGCLLVRGLCFALVLNNVRFYES